jgi:DNA processing protein
MIDPASSAPAAYEAALGLAWLSQSGSYALLRLLPQRGPKAIWHASRRQLLRWGLSAPAVDRFEEKRRHFAVGESEALLARAGTRFLPFGSSFYPPELTHLEFPPAGLFARATDGVLARLQCVPRVTIVGTRKATPYGLRAAETFAGAFAAGGIAVASGLAMGIDGRAHRATMEAGGLTVAVLGCGADLVYPRRHRELYERILGEGIVMSELPPGTPPARWTFPRRNRILAALGDAVLVIEGSRVSGAMQTAGWALDLGRPVFAVPGPIAVQSHEGCNRLLYDGAGLAFDPCATVEDFLLQTRIQSGERRLTEPPTNAAPASSRGGEIRRPEVAGSSTDSILEVLGSGPCSVDGMMGRTGLAARQVTVALAELEVLGVVARAGPGMYIRAP